MGYTLTAPQVRNDVENGLVELIRKNYPDVEVLMGTSTAGIAHAAMVGKECLCALCRKRLEAWPVCLCVVDGASNGVPDGITSQIRGRNEVKKLLYLRRIGNPFSI